MSTFKVDDKVLWRNPNDLSEVRICKIVSINFTGAIPYGVRCLNRPFSKEYIRATAMSLSPVEDLFAKVVVVGSHAGAYLKLAESFATQRIENRLDALYRTPDLVMFTGGEDVSPWMYGEERHEKTYMNPRRDSIEARVYKEAKRLGIPCLGICRGAQFLNVMNGGKLIQHVTNHTSPHDVRTSCGHSFQVTSTHHQMMDPTEGAEILAWATAVADQYDGLPKGFTPVLFDDKVVDPEVVLYRETGDLCVQYHPEIMTQESQGRKYFREILKELNQ